LQQHSIRKNFNFKFIKNELKRVVFKCIGKRCTWYIRAKKLSDGVTTEIYVLKLNHKYT